MSTDPVVIVSAARTPMGGFMGDLSPLSAPELGSVAIRAALERARIDATQVDEVIMGCVLPAGLGQAPARQASLKAGLPLSAGCTTVNKMCGSGMKTLMQAHDALIAGSVEIVIAGGMESMSNTPYLLPKVRSGLRIGHSQVFDHMYYDGLEDAYEKGRLMGSFAEDCARQFAFSREAQDEFAVASLMRAQTANKDGSFAWEMAPVVIQGKTGAVTLSADEQPFKAKLDKIPTLKPAFQQNGTVTAASSSSINDGAAAMVLMRESTARKLGCRPLARIASHATGNHLVALTGVVGYRGGLGHEPVGVHPVGDQVHLEGLIGQRANDAHHHFASLGD